MFRLVLGVHLACAFGATALFWIPVMAGKGGLLHVRAGRLYARLIYATAITGAPLAVLLLVSASDPATTRTAAFLAYLVTILVQPVFHGVRVVRARAGGAVGSPLHTALSLAAIVAGLAIGAAAIVWREWPFLLVSPIGPVMGVRALLYASRLSFPGWINRENSTGKRSPRWREEHIVSMAMSGIAVHTAMLVFGTTRTLHMTFTGAAAYVPWLLPTVLGLPLLLWTIRRDRRALAPPSR